MSISARTRKILWGLAGGQCSFTNCKVELINEGLDKKDNAIIGEESHIISKKVKGPRGDIPIESSRKDQYDNLILLCRNHHKLIDSKLDKFTVEDLHKMKHEHETWIKNNLRNNNSNEEFHYIPDPEIEKYSDYRLIHYWKYPDVKILCDSFGSNPEKVSPKTWSGNGFIFKRIRTVDDIEKVEDIITIYESADNVEYRCDIEALEITHRTYDPRTDNFSPFITERYEHDLNVEDKFITLRLSPETSSIETVLKILNLPKGEIDSNRIVKELYHLRNIGISIPNQALEYTKNLWKSWWCDGATAESLKEIEDQLEIISKLESN